MLVLNPLAQRMQIAVLILTMLTVLIFIGSTFTQHVSEYLALILLATVSMMFLVTTQNLLLIFLSLELLSLSLYILTAFNKRSDRVGGGCIEVFSLRWNFGSVSAVRVQSSVRPVQLDESLERCRAAFTGRSWIRC